MLYSHEKCPVCGIELHHIKYLDRPCKIAGGKKLSYLESVCNKIIDFKDPNPDLPYHQYFQVTSLYGTILFESVQFTDIGRMISVNHITMTSEIIYFPPVGSAPGPGQTLEFKNQILDLDYPKLEKIRAKISTLALFL